MVERGRVEERKASNRWLVIILILLCLVAGGIIAAIIFQKNKVEIDTYEEAVEYVWEYVENDDTEGFIDAAERAINGAKTDEVKADIHSIRAGELYNLVTSGNEQYLDMMKKDLYGAENLHPTADTAYGIYIYESEFGDPNIGEQYLRLAKERGLLDQAGEG